MTVSVATETITTAGTLAGFQAMHEFPVDRILRISRPRLRGLRQQAVSITYIFLREKIAPRLRRTQIGQTISLESNTEYHVNA